MDISFVTSVAFSAGLTMILVYGAAGFCGLAIAIHLVGIVIAMRRCRRVQAPQGSTTALSTPPITVLRPVCGTESFSAETLTSSFSLRYPSYEVIFCVADGHDPIVPLVRRLIAEYREIPAQLLVGDERLGINPKLNNLAKGWRAARHPWVAMTDSNVLLEEDALERLAARWEPGTGAVCSMPIGSRPANFWAELECAFLNTHQARFQYVSDAIGFGFAQGKTMLFERELIERHGGIRALASDPAEDAAATKLVRRARRHVRLVDRPFEQPLGKREATEVWSRQLRWARLRRNSFALLFLPEILVGTVPPSLALAAVAWHFGFSAPAAIAALLTLWYGTEVLLARRVGWHLSWRMPAAMLLRDLMLPMLSIAAWAGREFVWRGTPMQVPSSLRPRRHGDLPETADLPA